MNDIGNVLEKIRVSERWRSWLAVIVFLGFGGFLVIAGAAEGMTNQDTKGAVGFGLVFAAVGVGFLVRVLKMKATYARAANLIATGEVAHVFEQAFSYKGRPVWNYFVWTRGGDKLRVPVFKPALRDQLVAALPPGLVEPWSKERDKALKAQAA